jgi:ELWxxDGT repeat protein
MLDGETGLYLRDGDDPSVTLPEDRIQMYGELEIDLVNWSATFGEAFDEPTVGGMMERLREIAATTGVPAYLVEDAGALDPAWLEGAKAVGITAGASAPEGLVRELVAGSQSVSLQEARPFGNRLLFTCDDQTGFGSEPWISDGTFAGTFRLADLSPGAASSSPTDFVAVAPNRAVFTAFAPATGYELYVTDGTSAGTQLLFEFYAGTPGGNPDHLVAAFGGAVFGAATQAGGNELWFTDGTLAGTNIVADSLAGVTGASPAQIARVGSRVFYRGYSPAVGVELYVSDNTVVGTYVVADLATPISDSSPREITPASVTRCENILMQSLLARISSSSPLAR